MDSSRTHLLLGGAGFIGRHVAAGLLAKGDSVIIADRVVSESVRLFPSASHCRAIPADVTTADWDSLVDNVDVVHHYAWSSLPASANANPLGDLNTNLGATLGLLEALRRRGGGRVLFSSSGGTVYGRTAAIPIPEHHRLSPVTAYGAGKAATELYLGLYRDLHNLDCRVARISNPYGAGQNIRKGQGAVTTFLQRALDNQEIVIWGDGQTTRDYIHISDVVKALVAMSVVPSVGTNHTLNIGSGEGVSLNGIVRELERRLGRPLAVQRKHARSFDVAANVLDVSQARETLSWRPALSFAQGIERTLDDLATGRSMSRLD